MSKNLTRKGLALGAIVALGSSVFAGSPAFAANEINVAPAAGTSYAIASGVQFTLATTFAPGFTPASYAQLKYLVKTDANSTVKFAAQNTTTGLPAAVTAATAQAISTTSAAVSAASTGATDVAYLGLSAVTTSVTSAVEVTAFVDANNDAALTAGEWNTVKTVTFKKAADIVPVVALTQPSTGDTSLKATVVWGDLNVEQITDETVKFTAGTQIASATAGTLADGVWTKTATALAAAEVVTAQAYVGATALGTAVSGTATARTINTTNGLVANVLAGNDATATAATAIATTTAATVRLNGAFTAQVKAYDTTAVTALAAPSVAVVGKVTATTTATDLRPASTGVTEISVTVNGTKYTSEATLNAATVALTTDASGLASLTVSSVGLVASDVLTVSFAAQNITSSVVATQTAATFSVTESNVNDVYSTTPGATTALTYAVKDQFGQAVAGAYRVKTVVTGGTANTNYTPVVAGSATVNVLDTQLATATSWTNNTVVATLEVQDAATANWSNQAITAGDSTVIRYTTTADNFSVAPAVTHINGATTLTAKQTLATGAYADLVAPTSSTLGDAVWARVALTGTNIGAKYTVSGTGVAIWANAKSNSGSATVQASGSSEAVFIASNTTGTKTITFVTGAVTKTVDVVFGAAVVASRAAIAFGEGTTSSQAGRSVDVTAIVTDKFGNVVAGADAAISATGVGYLGNTTITTDASGKIVAKLIVGAGETGDAVVTASVTLADATVKTVVKTISFGVTDAQIDNVGKRVTAVASFSKGKTVAFYVDGVKKWSKLSASDADVVLNYNLKKGRHTVTVKISGGFVASEVIIVK